MMIMGHYSGQFGSRSRGRQMAADMATGGSWTRFVCSRSQLCLDTVLAAGQSFRWRKNVSGEWVGVMAGLVWKLRQTNETILYQVYGPDTPLVTADKSGHGFPRISKGNNQPSAELPDASVNPIVKQEFRTSVNSIVKQEFGTSVNPIVKQEFGTSEIQLTSESAQGISELKSSKCFVNGEGFRAVKLECCEGVKILKCDKLQDEGLNVLSCDSLQDEGMRLKTCNELQDKRIGMVKCDELLAKEIKTDKSQLQMRHQNGSRKSQRVIERMTSIKPNDWDKNNTDVPPVEASASKTLRSRREGNTEHISATNCAVQQLPHKSSMSGTADVTGPSRDDLHRQLLEDYFQTFVDLGHLYKYWSSKDPHFEKVAQNFQGVRLLRLNPTECLLSFVCSSNNHISRISGMVEKLCTHYGNLITAVDGVPYYTFPHLSALCGDEVESQLRQLGFGYRAKFIASIAKHVTQEKGQGWLESLRGSPYLQAKAELLTLLGVGSKVADCVCLMSLDKSEAVPVDTHVWQFTARHYMPKLHSAKSLTDKLYTEIGDFYRDLWGSFAGWAQAVLFAAALKHNKDRGEVQEGSSNKRKTCGEPGNQGLQASTTKRKDILKSARQGNK